MQPYDVAMVAVLVMATVFGAWKGMAWQLASLASLFLSYFVALRFGSMLAPYFGQQAPLNRFVAMLVLYLATSLVVWLLFRIVAGMIDRVRLKEFDRQLGALFGATKGVLLCVVITFFAITLSTVARDAILESRSGTYIAWLIEQSHPLMPAEVHEVIEPYLHRLDEELKGVPDEDRTAGARPLDVL